MITSTYIEGTSILHKTDPRIKIVLLIDMVLLLFTNASLFHIFFVFLFISFITILSLGVSRLATPFRLVLPIVVFILFLTPPFYREGNPVLIIGNRVLLTKDGLEQTLRLILRFSGITVVFFTFFATTTINSFILALQWFRLPYSTALIVTIALRYIPYMAGIYNNIRDAHTLRQTSLKGNNPIKKIKHLFPSLVSVLIHSIKSIPNLSMALELRGIGLKTKRTTYNSLKINRKILQLSITSVILLLSIWTILFY